MQKVQGLCERNEINRCLCHDKEIAEFPFDLRTFYFECRPTKVSAMANSVTIKFFPKNPRK